MFKNLQLEDIFISEKPMSWFVLFLMCLLSDYAAPSKALQRECQALIVDKHLITQKLDSFDVGVIVCDVRSIKRLFKC